MTDDAATDPANVQGTRLGLATFADTTLHPPTAASAPSPLPSPQLARPKDAKGSPVFGLQVQRSASSVTDPGAAFEDVGTWLCLGSARRWALR